MCWSTQTSTLMLVMSDDYKVCGAMGKKKADKMLFWTLDEFKAFEKAVSDRVVTRTVCKLVN